MLSLRRSAVAIFAASMLSALCSTTAWSEPRIVPPGDAAVTAFSGMQGGSAHDLIDLDGPSLRIFGLPGSGNYGLIDSTHAFSAKARDVGQVFGVTLDDQPNPNVYVAATAAYGLAIENARHERLRNGAPGAQYVPGLFGDADKAGGPGSIWRIDGTTGAIALFATVTTKDAQIVPASLGALAFDSQTQQIFVSDRATGLIHRFDLNGDDHGTFDHGVQGRQASGLPVVPFNPNTLANIQSKSFDGQNPRTWGFAPAERRVYALATHAGRLYYSVAANEQIWSVAIDSNGAFANDVRFEAALPSPHLGDEVSQISFDSNGLMYAAERGAPTGATDFLAVADSGQNRVVRFEPKQAGDTAPGYWHTPPDEYAVGTFPSYQNANGGVDLSCSERLWSTGDRLLEPANAATGSFPTIDGLQGNDSDLIKPANEPPEKSWFVNYYDHQADPLSRGHVGALAIDRECGDGGAAGYDNGGGGSLGIGYLPPLCPPGTMWRGGFCFYAHCPPGLVSVRGECRVPPTGCPPRLERANNGYCRCPYGQDLRDRQCVPRPCPSDSDRILQRDPDCCPTGLGRSRQIKPNCCPPRSDDRARVDNPNCRPPCPPTNGPVTLRDRSNSNPNCCPPGQTTPGTLSIRNPNCTPPCPTANGSATLRDRSNPNCCPPGQTKPGTLSIRNPNCTPPCPPANGSATLRDLSNPNPNCTPPCPQGNGAGAIKARGNPNCTSPCPPAGSPATLSVRKPKCKPLVNNPCPPGTVRNPNCSNSKPPCARHSAGDPDCKAVVKPTHGMGHTPRRPHRPHTGTTLPVRNPTGKDGDNNTGHVPSRSDGDRGSRSGSGDMGGHHHGGHGMIHGERGLGDVSPDNNIHGDSGHHPIKGRHDDNPTANGGRHIHGDNNNNDGRKGPSGRGGDNGDRFKGRHYDNEGAP
jgi:hypothetical protein